jgi:hypothetical protein
MTHTPQHVATYRQTGRMNILKIPHFVTTEPEEPVDRPPCPLGCYFYSFLERVFNQNITYFSIVFATKWPSKGLYVARLLGGKDVDARTDD